MEYTVNIELKGQTFSIETGRWARQAGGSVVVRWGKMVLLATATVAKEPTEGIDFFPLTVEYREKFYSTGKIPGGFIKREGRPTDKEILVSRLADRPIRPLFPENFFQEVQVFVTLLSSASNLGTDIHAITAASAALMVSEAPFAGPVAGVRIGRLNGRFIFYPDLDELEKSDLNLALAGTEEAVTMIEGSAREVSEEVMLEAIQLGHQEIRKLCAIQKELAQKAGKPKLPVNPPEDHSELKKYLRQLAYDDLKKANAVRGKQARQAAVDEVFEQTLKKLENEWLNLEESERSQKLKIAAKLLQQMEVELVRQQIFQEKRRADGRALDEIRPLSIEVGILPGTHGSALFTRGETQSLGVVTLGTESDAQAVDDISGEISQRFYLQYNFPPFSVGEVRRYTGPGRREIGHGKLAENSLLAVIPEKEEFPYVIRVVSEILESNGSSSMATVCSASLALMDAGVPTKAPVAGIAMGLITEQDKYAVLTDIAGLEDHFGDMDFKVAGTEKGITGFQLDLKVKGITPEIMREALYQAKKGRLEILKAMKAVLPAPRPELSENAPRITTIQIDKDRIGELIGPGGKNIRAIIEKSGAQINIDDNGMVSIAATNGESARIARELIEGQFAEAEVGKVYEGVVKAVVEYGAFIEILPGKQGLCHISKISDRRVSNVADVLKEGQKVKVRVVSIDRTGKISLSMKDV
ncbi:MAG: polyribonucleotide nucleotidyltransferase [Leptospiraceae bacterium]|nr:polyribonucleotide nucleotidyltransferase [Leptospiraceae bacterium]MDW8307530.1 polyribonucleotide nucleotidyltransferase [Leptospiraceae bacterium]